MMSTCTVRDRLATPDGASLRYSVEGSGPAIVLVHGWALTLDLWDAQALALRDAYRVVRWDRRGCGESTGSADLSADALDLFRLLDHLDIARAAVLGMSQGVRVALLAAQHAPQRITALILDGAPAKPPAPGEPREFPLGEFRRLLETDGVPAMQRAISRHAVMQLATRDLPTREQLRAMIARYQGHDLRMPQDLTASDNALREPALAAIETPTLVLNGALDSAARVQHGELIAATIPRAERVVLSGAGHLANLDRPADYVAHVREFLERVSSSAEPLAPRR
jgi:pimeloyl-ACP methyl ester carboxylesterase